jgi:HK97 family phage prohead protease
MYFNHDENHVVGIWKSINADEHGLYVKGHLFMHDDLFVKKIKNEKIDGMSIGVTFSMENRDAIVIRDTTAIVKADVFEISIIAIPADRKARIINRLFEEKEKWCVIG